MVFTPFFAIISLYLQFFILHFESLCVSVCVSEYLGASASINLITQEKVDLES